MKRSLGWPITTCILILILLLHAAGLLSLLLAQLESLQQEKELIISLEDQESPMSERDWVAMNNSLPDTQFAQIDESIQEQPQLEEEASHETDSQIAQKTPADNQMDQAVAVAQQMLEAAQEPIIEEKADDSEWVAIQVPKNESEEKEIVEQLKKEVELTHASTNQLPELKSSPTEKKLSLAQLTQGFVQHLEQAAMAVKSDKSGAASIDQMKHLHFCQKIIGCIVNSYKIHSHQVPHDKSMGQLRIQLALNENGSIHTLRIDRSSGNPSIDRFLMQLFKDASSSFPPVPATFKEKPYTLPTFNIDRLEAFQSQQGWYIDNRMS